MQVWALAHPYLTFLIVLFGLFVTLIGFKSIGGAYQPRIHHCNCDCDENDDD